MQSKSQLHQQAASAMLQVFNLLINCEVSEAQPLVMVGAFSLQHKLDARPKFQLPFQFVAQDPELRNIIANFVQELSEYEMQQSFLAAADESGRELTSQS